MRNQFTVGVLTIAAATLMLIPSLFSPPVRAQQPDTGARPRPETQANLDGLEVQKRQVSEMEKQRLHELEEQAADEIARLRSDADRQIEQTKRQVHRQIEQLRTEARRRLELLDAQTRVVKAQASSPTEHPPARASTIEEKLDRIIAHLEQVDRRLDKLEGKK
jgi:hypothetical protein